MVVGGYSSGGSTVYKAEVINVQTNTRCTSVPDYPVSVNFATGAVLNGKPTVCGRQSSQTDCYGYNINTNEWEAVPGMAVGRDWHKGSVLINGPWVITGGDSSTSIGKSYEFWNGIAFEEVPTELPDRLYGHCQVS